MIENPRHQTTKTEPNKRQIGLCSADFAQNNGQALVTQRVANQVLPSLGVVREYVFSPSGSPMALLSWILASGRLWRDAATQRLDTLYVVCSRSTLGFLRDLPALVLSRLGLKVVVHAHGSDIVSLLRERRISPLARWAYRRCVLVVPSAHLLPMLRGVQLSEFHVCENFFQGEHIEVAPPNDDMKLTVLWNSNIMGSKGAFDLFEAVRKLKVRGLELDLKVIGQVLGDEEYTQARAQSQLSSAIADGTACFLGALPAAEANSLVTRVDVVALPSRYRSELQPLALIEAMCAGKAIVAGNTPALRAALNNYPAEFVSLHSIDDIADALERLVNERRAGPEAFAAKRSVPAARARERFSSARFDQTLVAILNSAQNGSMN